MSHKEEALKEKELGNAAYKKKDFEEALARYRKAYKLDPTDMRFLLNQAAAMFEKGDYQTAAKFARDAAKVGEENDPDNKKLIAKAYVRSARSYENFKHFSFARRYYQESLKYEYSKEIEDMLPKLEETAKKVDVELDRRHIGMADLEREYGNFRYKQRKYDKALESYEASIRRNADKPHAFSDRAECYQAIGEHDLALKDCDTSIHLDSTHMKGHLGKAISLRAKGDYENALESFRRAIQLDENSVEALRGYKEVMMILNSDPAGVERRARYDPLVDDTMKDEKMMEIIQQMRDDPLAGREHMKDPEVAHKIQRLVQSGILLFR
ncbi:stress-induced-phosphoprotein 1-like [Amphibalanus amphitrite]|uniref:stress-induced-phosphoprotein 1-like n=1 Tax=Amphibalanus amphitrite TaxID=1232801 RepID=UPI001C92A212|nr:stress-induced-phosphoprotein 1-like [Amphibalanus amphitrite]XP_043230363.1 stress-induced-phosphoprotein 1-like [Amphibalanus amphitrite]XP_043230364.1 stress-induced-phosphoprotein 1-like [Amphibalanus amphitrite]XP_043230365.1 stress-induced-phosphoprotein 1-like [Amphibalanus amphitrite]XP_043230366.1 stress-induced-phosphoprotein 1-like [Amphibalanus amphitrite]